MILKYLCCSEGGFFRAELHFPKEYPQKPPKMKFTSDIWHPNGKRLQLSDDALNCLKIVKKLLPMKALLSSSNANFNIDLATP